MLNTAVLFIVFNRPDTTVRVFEAIQKAKPTKLYIAADAARVNNEADAVKCKEVREIVSNINWKCEVKTLFQEHNLGCSLGVRTAFDWFFTFEDEGIILEDDCLPSPDFFYFCSELLEKYRHDEKIISINGSNLGYKLENGDSYTFSRFMNMWGWATWKRSAVTIDYYLKEWGNEKHPIFTLYKYLRQNLFDIDINWYKYWQEKFDRIVKDVNTTWDWQWVYHQVRDKKLTILPSVNLVTNIGFNVDATNTLENDNPAANIPYYPMAFPLRHPSSKKPDIAHYEDEYVKWIWCYYKRLPKIFYVKKFVSGIFKKQKR